MSSCDFGDSPPTGCKTDQALCERNFKDARTMVRHLTGEAKKKKSVKRNIWNKN